MQHQTAETNANRLTIALFSIYLAALCWILLLKLGVKFSYMNNRRVNLVPFRNILQDHGRIANSEILMNVLIFVPLGLYAGILFSRWSFKKKVLFFFLVSFIVESLQYILAIGSFDATDIITNTTGGILGLLTYIILAKTLNNRFKAQKVINIIAVLGTVLMVLFLGLLKLNMLPVRYQ
ncbi:Glycopeptide antibiotics resistance protein [Cnuella takakiae]|uniref:Glycopeptide antibiotics resistance protein n=1 Tax=Cnuella takakiae TaxID=1302690 RepID=A0A1M4Y560_9BACT|nr:VanZ family protein [Cnuella takakiae]OLY94867.1 hypothetical protein BUE76_14985 [Cnuella takakiae]SHF00957.1 Glycopeptide antibiotics resistance protein [Cnuella takakiae]